MLATAPFSANGDGVFAAVGEDVVGHPAAFLEFEAFHVAQSHAGVHYRITFLFVCDNGVNHPLSIGLGQGEVFSAGELCVEIEGNLMDIRTLLDIFQYFFDTSLVESVY